MAKRRGHGEGSITERKRGIKRFQAAISINGHRLTRYFATRREASEWLHQIRSQVQGGYLPEARNITLQEFIERWLESVAKVSLRVRTYERYCELARLHVIPYLGNMKLQALRPDHLQTLYGRLNLHPNTVRFVHLVIHRALGDAVRWGLVPRNVASAARPPRRVRPQIKVLSDEEVAIYLKAAREDPYYPLWLLALLTGMRAGEIMGLRWENVDLPTGVISVRQSLQRSRTQGVIYEEPKTAKGRRSIPLSPMAIEALREHYKNESEKALRFPGSSALQFVFTDEQGKAMYLQKLRRLFREFLARAGLPCIRFHDIRHTTATLLLKCGVHPKVVQERLGHANISLTMDIYSHVTPGIQEEASLRLERVIRAQAGLLQGSSQIAV